MSSSWGSGSLQNPPYPGGKLNLEEAVYRDELDQLGERLNLTLVDVLEQAPEDWTGETGFVREEILDRHLPRMQRTDLHYFLCGPPPMMKAAEDALHAFGVPAHRIHTEVFALV
jgi:NAD(P)H-flavin reductase